MADRQFIATCEGCGKYFKKAAGLSGPDRCEGCGGDGREQLPPPRHIVLSGEIHPAVEKDLGSYAAVAAEAETVYRHIKAFALSRNGDLSRGRLRVTVEWTVDDGWPGLCPECGSNQRRQEERDTNPWCRGCGHFPTLEECLLVREVRRL